MSAYILQSFFLTLQFYAKCAFLYRCVQLWTQICAVKSIFCINRSIIVSSKCSLKRLSKGKRKPVMQFWNSLKAPPIFCSFKSHVVTCGLSLLDPHMSCHACGMCYSCGVCSVVNCRISDDNRLPLNGEQQRYAKVDPCWYREGVIFTM